MIAHTHTHPVLKSGHAEALRNYCSEFRVFSKVSCSKGSIGPSGTQARQYWLRFTEYLRAPAVQHFPSLPGLLLQAHAPIWTRRQRRSNSCSIPSRCFAAITMVVKFRIRFFLFTFFGSTTASYQRAHSVSMCIFDLVGKIVKPPPQ